MIQEKVIIKNPLGLHIRPAGVLAKIATDCNSKITMIFKDKTINCKSILNIMSANIKNNDEVTVVCEGETEKEDLQLIIEAIKNRLGE